MKAKKSALTARSPVTISSRPSLGQDVFVTPLSVPRGSDRSRSEHSGDEAFFLSVARSSISSTYLSPPGDQTTTGLITDGTLQGFSRGGSHNQAMTLIVSFCWVRADKIIVIVPRAAPLEDFSLKVCISFFIRDQSFYSSSNLSCRGQSS